MFFCTKIGNKTYRKKTANIGCLHNTCKSVSLTYESVVFEVQDSIIAVDLSDVKLNKRFVEYSKEIFKELLTTKL